MTLSPVEPGTNHSQLTPRLIGIMATACALCVANVYYNQPLLGYFAAYFKAPAWCAGLVATAAQVGYGLGMLFFLPLGDLIERRRLVLGLVWACFAALLATALAPNLACLIVAQLVLGICSISAQVLIPLAAEMGLPSQRGRIVGAMMSGVLAGILLARVFSGLVADQLGWRTVYFAAAAAMVALALVLRSCLPHRPPAVTMSYLRLMGSLLDLVRTQRVLRYASMTSALSFGAFMAFWSTLSFLMIAHFHRGASEAGLFGLVGLVGAAGAPWAGRLADARGSSFTVNLALGLVAVSFVLMGAWVTWVGLILGVLLMDLGVQSVQVASQSEVLSLLPEARSRVNTVYMVARFTGAAAGSMLGAAAWSLAGWIGVCSLCLAATLLALVLHFIGFHRKPACV